MQVVQDLRYTATNAESQTPETNSLLAGRLHVIPCEEKEAGTEFLMDLLINTYSTCLQHIYYSKKSNVIPVFVYITTGDYIETYDAIYKKAPKGIVGGFLVVIKYEHVMGVKTHEFIINELEDIVKGGNEIRGLFLDDLSSLEPITSDVTNSVKEILTYCKKSYETLIPFTATLPYGDLSKIDVLDITTGLNGRVHTYLKPNELDIVVFE